MLQCELIVNYYVLILCQNFESCPPTRFPFRPEPFVFKGRHAVDPPMDKNANFRLIIPGRDWARIYAGPVGGVILGVAVAQK